MKRTISILAVMLPLLFPAALLAAPQKKAPPTPVPVEPQRVVLRHALSGAALDALATLTLRFNDEEAKLKSGSGLVQLEDARGVAEKARLPHLALFDQDDAMEIFDSRPRFRPLHQVMATGKLKFDAKTFYPQIFDAVDDVAGNMQALPLALSLPVLFYNKDAFVKAGLDPETPPKTWWELQEAAGKLRDAGSRCPLTSSRFAWVHVENVASQHAEPLVVKQGKNDRLALNNLVNVKHMSLLTTWQKSFYFIYSGRGVEGDERFASGECAMLTGASALYGRLKKEKPELSFGLAVLPHYDDVYGVRPTQVLPDGQALWVLAADKKPELAVIARYIAFLMRPDVQRDWVRTTGFLPMTPGAMQALRESGANPSLLANAETRLVMPKRDAGRTKHADFGRSRIRAILDEEVEFVWGDHKPPKAALDTAVARAAAVLAPPPTAKK
jgi:sn-glycerol 3-phosphate transport system substrate-binding protein